MAVCVREGGEGRGGNVCVCVRVVCKTEGCVYRRERGVYMYVRVVCV